MRREALLCLSMSFAAPLAFAQIFNAKDPVVKTTSLPAATVGVPYSASLSASGGKKPYTWSIARGTLPSGLALAAAMGDIAGVPSASGISRFTVTVTDDGGLTGAQPLSIVVAQGSGGGPGANSLSLTPSLPDGTVTAPYSATATASGGVPPYGWSLTAGSLPGGLTLDALSGAIGGVPSAAGTFSFTIAVVDSAQGSASQSYQVTISPAPSIKTKSLKNGKVGAPYSAQLDVSGGKAPYVWSASGLPSGLNLDTQTGAITGIPAAGGSFSVTVQVTDANGATAPPASLSLTIATAVAPLTIATASLPNGIAGAAYSASLAASGGATPYTWSATGLPAGLTLNAQTGAIAGAPTSPSSSTVVVKVTDASNTSASKSYTITVAGGLAITTGALPGGTTGTAYSASLAASGGTPPYTWSITSGSLPAGLTLNAGNGQVTGTPTAAGTANFTVRVSDAGGSTASKSFSIAISAPTPALAITTGALPGGTTGTAYSASLAASGGTPPYTWSVTNGSLPAGLTLNSGSGQITGTPTAAGTANFTVRVSDTGELTASKSLSIAISAPTTPLTISGTFAAGTVGTAYSQTLTASGGTPPYTWSVTSGSLPPGLTLGSSGGTVSGTPTQAGSFSFTVQVADGAGAAKSLAASISIGPGFNITPASLPDGSIGAQYLQRLNASGGSSPYTWSVQSGSLPTGLALGAGTGFISGIPTATGTFSFSIQVRDGSGNSATASYSITIVSGLTITSTSPLPVAAVGTSYSQALAAISGVAPYTWVVSSGLLPQGIRLDSATGLLSGAPGLPGTYNFTVSVRDASAASASKAFTLTVVNALSVSTVSLPGGSLSTPYSQTLAAVAGTSPYTWSVTVGSLPPGLSLNAGTGAITGTPTTQGAYNFTVQVKDAVSATATKALTIPIGPALSVTSGPALPGGVLASPYSQTLTASGGTAPYTWSIASGALPAGLALNAATGAIAGTPQAAGTFQFTVQVTDSTRATASANLSLTVAAQGVPAVTITDLPDTAAPLEQPAVGLSLATPYPVELKGQLVLSFAPDAVVEGDDPAIQFSTGGRTVDFTIPANTTRAAFPASTVQLQTGSVAGTITVTAKLEAGGADITPNPVPSHSLKISRSAPVIRSVKLVKTVSGFEVWITGYAPSREITEATVQLTPSSGSTLQTTSVKAPMIDAARQWYQDPASQLYGSQFTIVQPFTVVGNANAVASVSVTLANTIGSSNAVSASF